MRYIDFATDLFESLSDTAVMLQTFQLSLPQLCDLQQLPKYPLAAVDSVTVTDAAGDPVAVDPTEYTVRKDAMPGVLYPTAAGWPAPGSPDDPFPYQIVFQAGYSTPDAVPQSIRQAILLLAGHMYEHRVNAEDVDLREIPYAFDAIVKRHKVCYHMEEMLP